MARCAPVTHTPADKAARLRPSEKPPSAAERRLLDRHLARFRLPERAAA